MKTRALIFGLLVAAVLATPTKSATLAAAGGPQDFSGAYNCYSGPSTCGWTFTVNQNLTLVALGQYDYESDGLNADARIGLWTSSGGDPIAEVTIAAGTGFLVGEYRYAYVAPLTLEVGQTYVIGSQFSESPTQN